VFRPPAVPTISLFDLVMIDGAECPGKPWDAMLPVYLRNYKIGPTIFAMKLVVPGCYSLGDGMWAKGCGLCIGK
jgi:hypothetical protein